MLGWRGIAWFSRSWNERGGRPGASEQWRRRRRVRGGGAGGVRGAQRRGRDSGALGEESAVAAARLFHFVGRCAKPYANTCGWRAIRAGKCAAGLAGAHYEAWPNPQTLSHSTTQTL